MYNKQLLSVYNSNAKKKSMNINNPIDIVYLYVNSTDIKWQQKILKYTKDIDPQRYTDYGEIYFSLKTIEKFFNKVRTIFIVTDNQTLDNTKLSKWAINKIKYINHIDIIPVKYLPTFNSSTIETFIYRINHLSELFYYFNDDCFLGNYLTQNNIFNKQNVPYSYGNINKKKIILSKKHPWVYNSFNSIKLFVNKYNIYPDVITNHNAIAIIKSSAEKTYNMFHIKIENSISMFREPKNIIFPLLLKYISLYMGYFELKHSDISISMKIHCNDVVKKIPFNIWKEKLMLHRPLFFCINNIDKTCIQMYLSIINTYLKKKHKTTLKKKSKSLISQKLIKQLI